MIGGSTIDVPGEICPDLIGEPLESVACVFSFRGRQRLGTVRKMSDQSEELVE